VPTGRFSTNASITVKITAALDGGMLNQRSVDRDPQIGITDGRVMNEYWIVNINNYPNWPHCYALSASGSQKPSHQQFQFQTSSLSSSNQPRGLGLAPQLRMVGLLMWEHSTIS